MTGLTGHQSSGPHHVIDVPFCRSSGVNTEADWTSDTTDETDVIAYV